MMVLTLLFSSLVLQPVACGINPEEYEEQNGEAPEGGTAIAEEWQGNTNDRGKTKYHAHVDEHVEQEYA